jgi:hypothetical protein
MIFVYADGDVSISWNQPLNVLENVLAELSRYSVSKRSEYSSHTLQFLHFQTKLASPLLPLTATFSC